MINVIAKSKNEKEYFVILNTRDKGLESGILTEDDVFQKTIDLFNVNYVYARNRESVLRQIVDIVLLDEKNEPVSMTRLYEQVANDREFQEEVERLLEMAEVK